ncbi:MAG: deoxynucleoside kinase [Myxococcales bacterium]|nr:deoxynucleoside kinase [Myxococcales bacterium]
MTTTQWSIGMAYQPPNRKMFIALAGNIGCGKTTAAKLISRTFDLELFDEPVIDNRFLADYYKDMARWSFTLQLEFLIKRTQHHELIARVPKSCIQDRTLYEDPEIFAKYLHGLGYMDDRELELYFEDFERLNRDLHRPDKVITFTVDNVDVLLNRISSRGREEEKEMQANFLQGLNGFYTAFPSICEKKYGMEVLNLDVSSMDIRSGEGKGMLLDKVNDFLHH